MIKLDVVSVSGSRHAQDLLSSDRAFMNGVYWCALLDVVASCLSAEMQFDLISAMSTWGQLQNRCVIESRFWLQSGQLGGSRGFDVLLLLGFSILNLYARFLYLSYKVLKKYLVLRRLESGMGKGSSLRSFLCVLPVAVHEKLSHSWWCW